MLLLRRAARPRLMASARALVQTRRRIAQPTGRSVRDEGRKQQAKTVAQSRLPEIAEKLVVYHAGTGRTVFLALVKVTSLFVAGFFCLVAAPACVAADRPLAETAGVVLCGIVPLALVAYTTAPFVTHVHMHLPPAARLSRPLLDRFVAALPPTTRLTLTTMSLIAKPRYSSLRIADLRPANRRFGLVNYVRDDVAAENAARAWYNHAAVARFYLSDAPPSLPHRKQSATADPWIWHLVRDKIAKRAASAASP